MANQDKGKRTAGFRMETSISSSIVVLISAFNEEDGIGPTIAEFKEVLQDPTYLIVDRTSNDKTVEISKELGAEILFQKGRGKGNAISQGLNSINHDPKYVVFTD